MKLSNDALADLPHGVAGPAYDRSRLTPGILHFGVGNFHRAHQAVYLDRLMDRGAAQDWAIVGAGTRPGDIRVHDVLAAQDWLSTVVEQSAERSTARVTGAMIAMHGPDDRAGIAARLRDPQIRIVSLTITEGGYFVSAETGNFDATHPDIVADGRNPDDPRSVFGMIVSGLKARREAGVAPFTVMSCDNLPHNGAITRAAVVGTARLQDPELAGWIEANVSFPNGMVDRITPATGDRERRLVREEYGIDDEWPVFAEDFIQWVLEDDFPAGRPPLEDVGVEFVADVAAHEAMKLRILNAGHAVIAYPAGLLDIEYAHEAMAHPLVAGFLDKVERTEIIPTVPSIPGTDPGAYYERVRERFANPKIADTIRRLCLDGSNRQPKFVVPTIRDRLAGGLDVTGLALECALWCRYCVGTTESGAAIEPNDPSWPVLTALAARARHEPQLWLDQVDVYGDLGRDERFGQAFGQALDALWRDGTVATLDAYIGA